MKRLILIALLCVFILSAFSPLPSVTQKSKYNVNFVGHWKKSERAAVMTGVEQVAKALSRVTGEPPVQAFNRVFGKVTFRKVTSLSGGWFARTSGRTIWVHRAYPRLIVHELGHVFSYVRRSDPERQLYKDPIRDPEGRFITGSRNGHYDRNGGRKAPRNGYKSDYSGANGYQQHPRNTPFGNTATEDWGDIFMNWVYQSFVNNRAGKAINRWTSEHMNGWIKK